MKRVCSWCKRTIGEKEPVSDPSETSAICPECYKNNYPEIYAVHHNDKESEKCLPHS